MLVDRSPCREILYHTQRSMTTCKPRRSRTGCLTCRDRHVKCDEGTPRCQRCLKIGRECVRGWNVKFVHGVRSTREAANDEWDGTADYLFDADQKWIPIRFLNMTFVDETEETESWYNNSTEHSPVLPAQNLLSSAANPPSFQSHVETTPSPTSRSRALASSSHKDQFSSPGSIINEPFVSHYASHGVVDSSLGLLRDSQVGQQEPLPRTESVPRALFGEHVRLSSREEAFLVHHYVRKRAPLLDICDPLSHFGRCVPELATDSPLLYNALLAVSAHDLSRTAGHAPMMAELYHERCVELLIPMLDDLFFVSEDVIAATVLLRNYEQMASGVTGVDCERHLSGTCAFMSAERINSATTARGLRQASFWIFVRQDLDVALCQQRPLKLNLDAYSAEMDLESPCDDCAWANRMVWITAEVVAFSFGWDRPRMRYEELRIKAETWFQGKPQSFRPLFYGPGEAFPTVYYSQPCHAVGMQYYCIAMILLAVGDSQRVKLGFGHKESRQRLQEEVTQYSDLLFGTCTSVDDPETRITACNAISVCAPWLTDRRRQESLISMLHDLERDVAWPTKAVSMAAMAEWNWSEDEAGFNNRVWYDPIRQLQESQP